MQHAKTASLLAAATVAIAGSLANAGVIQGTITADNHYALYTSTSGIFSYHGGNELGAGGSPGSYNWSVAEPVTFAEGDFLYIAAWSDDSVAQGVLASFNSPGLGTILSGDPRWQVFATGINRNDGSAHPTTTEVSGHVLNADTNNLWETPFVGGNNGISPWGNIAGISGNARWMWFNTPGDSDPLQGGSAAGEMLIFRTVVPAPSAAALLGLGGLAVARRRR
jgi:hypothetical protein